MTHHHSGQLGGWATVIFALAISIAPFSGAQDAAKPPVTPITIAQLKGTWSATLSGVTGCGTTTLTTTFTLDASGNGSQLAGVQHTAGCGDIDLTGLSAQIQSFNGDGSGFIAFGCGSGCGLGFNMQVNKTKQVFNLGPQAVPGNYLAGVAVKKNL